MSGWDKLRAAMKGYVILLSVLLCSSLCAQSIENASTWKESLTNKKGTITAFWESSKPFIYKNQNSELVGIEVELLTSFQKFVKNEYDVELSINWQELGSFNEVYTRIKNSTNEGYFGISSISTVSSRKLEVGFSPTYLKDISIITSKNGVPTINTTDEFFQIFSGFHAIASKNSTHEKNALELKKQYDMNFDIHIMNNIKTIINILSNEDSVFGYIELPHYLVALNEGHSIKRHNFAPVVREGYAIAYPLNSDWQEPIDAYFNRVSFQFEKDQIISKYLGSDVLALIQKMASGENINSTNEIGLLIKEKEIQERELNKAALERQKEEFLRNLLILGLLFIIVFAGTLFYNNHQKSKTNAKLQEQQNRIREQQNAIAQKNTSLASKNKNLNDLNDQKNDLIRVLSHDLRAPINQIKGFAQLYKAENVALSGGQSGLIDRIISTSDRVTDMIRKIMDVEALDTNKLDIKMERVNLSELLKEVSTSFQELAKNKNIEISTEVEKEGLHIEADQTYLTQVFENLVSNAIKFSKSNTIVEIKLRLVDDKILSIIKDQGPGLTDEDKKKLFKKYQKLSASPTDGEQSTGLGLSIVNNYVKKMNGKVWAESSDGNGSSFIVEFNRVA